MKSYEYLLQTFEHWHFSTRNAKWIIQLNSINYQTLNAACLLYGAKSVNVNGAIDWIKYTTYSFTRIDNDKNKNKTSTKVQIFFPLLSPINLQERKKGVYIVSLSIFRRISSSKVTQITDKRTKLNPEK